MQSKVRFSGWRQSWPFPVNLIEQIPLRKHGTLFRYLWIKNTAVWFFIVYYKMEITEQVEPTLVDEAYIVLHLSYSVSYRLYLLSTTLTIHFFSLANLFGVISHLIYLLRQDIPVREMPVLKWMTLRFTSRLAQTPHIRLQLHPTLPLQLQRLAMTTEEDLCRTLSAVKCTTGKFP